MVLVDTSVWIRHLREGDLLLRRLLIENTVLTHPFVKGELACGNLKQRKEFFNHFAVLPISPIAEHEEVLEYIENHKLMGRGLGWIDAHLLASATLAHASVWTLDRALSNAARSLHLLFHP